MYIFYVRCPSFVLFWCSYKLIMLCWQHTILLLIISRSVVNEYRTLTLINTCDKPCTDLNNKTLFPKVYLSDTPLLTWHMGGNFLFYTNMQQMCVLFVPGYDATIKSRVCWLMCSAHIKYNFLQHWLVIPLAGSFRILNRCGRWVRVVCVDTLWDPFKYNPLVVRTIPGVQYILFIWYLFGNFTWG